MPTVVVPEMVSLAPPGIPMPAVVVAAIPSVPAIPSVMTELLMAHFEPVAMGVRVGSDRKHRQHRRRRDHSKNKPSHHVLLGDLPRIEQYTIRKNCCIKSK
jgi:hypothetical protein